jgi:4-hydroxy 2-oxovalerate aldolase
MNINFIECTLRDGGYHNNWDFEQKLVKDYLKTMSLLDFKNIEFGFRFIENKHWLGEFAYTSEDTIKKYSPSSKFNLGVMINCSDFVEDKLINFNNIEKVFPVSSSKSKLNFVRIATHIKDFDKSLDIAHYLSGKGYKLAINIMQAHNLNESLIVDFSKKANNLDLTSLYFADSLGCLLPNDVQKMVTTFKENYQGEIGIHAHDNMGFALVNSIESILNGASWIDSTITGMGRGPGNARTEEIFMYYMNKNNVKKNSKIVELIEEHFSHLKYKYKWGSNPFYFLSALNKVHPSYIQDMEKDKSFSVYDKFAFLNSINKKESQSYKPELKEKLDNFFIRKNKEDTLKNKKFLNANYLIIGSGPSVEKYKKDIELFIKKYNPTVFQLNNASQIDRTLIDYHVISHPQRFIPANISSNDKRNYIIPNVNDFDIAPSSQVLHYDIEITKNSFKSHKLYTKIPNGLALTFALGIVEKNDFKKTVYTAGIDGYTENILKNNELNKTIKLYQNTYKKNNLLSITPSNLDIAQKNIHSF